MKNFDKPLEIEQISKKKIAEMSPEYQGDRYGAESYSCDHMTDDCFGRDILDVVENSKERLMPVEERLIKMGYFVENAVKQNQREVEERRTFTQDEAAARIHLGVLDTVERFRGLMLKIELMPVTDSFLCEAVEIPEIRTALREQASLVSKSTLAKYRKFRRTLSPLHSFLVRMKKLLF